MQGNPVMLNDQVIGRIIDIDAQGQADWARQLRELASQYRLTATPNCDQLVYATLRDGVNNFLGSGSFSRVYAIDDDRVLKCSYDLTSLQIMQKLCSRSNYFPRVDLLLEHQACDGDVVFHAAVVERLQEGYPRWVRSIVDGYRAPFPADSPNSSHLRLLGVGWRIESGNIVVPPSDVAPLSEAMRILAEECLSWRCVADLRTEVNFMMRADGQVVIADPAHPYHPF
jgi:hypothetical protein